VQCIQKCHKRSSFRRAEIFSVGWHISSTLDYLANKLIFGKVQSNTVERRPALPPFVIQRMTVVTLLGLKNERAMALQSRTAL
jgi:hypothetical protein